MKILNVILFSLLTSFDSSACWWSSSQEVSLQEDTLTVVQTAEFCLGSGNNCPQIQNYDIIISGNQICIEVYYNEMGVWLSNQCTKVDTIREVIPVGMYDVVFKSYTYEMSDTTLVDTDNLGIIVIPLSAKYPGLIEIVDHLGRPTDEEPNKLLIYIYSDGTTEKRYGIE